MTEDVVVIGGGPAGLSAALNARLEGFSTLLIERNEWGGRAAQSARIDNLLGFSGVQGPTLARLGRKHCEEHGVTTLHDEVIYIDGSFLRLASGHSVSAKAVVLATGIQFRELEIAGLREAIAADRARYGCMPDAALRCAGKRIAILGGANSAGINALHFLACGAREVVIITKQSLGGMSYYLQNQILQEKARGRVWPMLYQELEEVQMLEEGLALQLSKSERKMKVDELFLFPDALPTTHFVSCAKDEQGFVIAPDFTTSLPGLFAAGDIRAGSRKRIATAMGEGAAVIFNVKHYLENLHKCRVCAA